MASPGRHPNQKKHWWKPGQSGNPAGRKAFGAYVAEWMNVMAQWPLDQLDDVIDDPDQPSAKVAAAQRVKSARQDGKLAGDDFDRCCDRTVGRPSGLVEVSGTVGHVHVNVDDDLVRLVGNLQTHPEIIEEDGRDKRLIEAEAERE